MLVSISVITLDERVGTHHLTAGVKSVANDVFAPVRRGVNDLVDPIGGFVAGMVNYRNLEQENERLRAMIGRLRENQAEQSYAQTQLRQLSSLAHLSYLGNLPTVAAQVVSKDTSNFDATIQINKGRDQGVEVGMPVGGDGGLVGQVTETSHNTATVTLVTDGQSKVGVTFGPGNDTYWANVQGQGPGESLRANYVQPGTPLRRGEIMYTNQLQGGQFPSGIPVGTVARYQTISGASQMTIWLAPSADLANLTYVDVVQWVPSP